ncbi:hypothetical protein ES332_1Z010900v1 [Gossypium tomentosum]|uniref:NAC domain-containing protein n=1 Tax=Gossypium tomentosum TaxID=34277 RepID=A0A5C7J0Z0_GOSTO|nr:hypothetical protein ES332_1Z010900v1 [Gossypium tomentosum]
MEVLTMGTLPLGFRFRPTDEELINHYLRLKINGRHSEVEVIPEIDVCKWEPWDLPGLSVIKSDDLEWFFFCPRDRKRPWFSTRAGLPRVSVTNWIMHEYRPTTKELDGTAPGQSAFVLCRLFHKVEERNDIVKYDEVEQTGYSPAMIKSSPDDTSSDLLQDTVSSDTQAQKPDNLMQNDRITGDTSSCNSHMTSNADYHATEETMMEKYPLPGSNSNLSEPNYGEIDSKVFSPLMNSQLFEDLSFFVDSPYANDFGHDQNGFHFQDGTSEQDVSFAFLDDILSNHYDSYTTTRNLTSQRNGRPADTDTEMPQLQFGTEVGARRWLGGPIDNNQSLQMKTSFQPTHTQPALYNQEYRTRNIGGLGNYSVGQGTFTDSAMGNINNLQTVTEAEAAEQTSSSDEVREDIVNQGTAPRRIHLQTKLSTGAMKGSAGCANGGNMTSPGLVEEEVQSALTEVTEAEAAGLTSSSDEPMKGSVGCVDGGSMTSPGLVEEEVTEAEAAGQTSSSDESEKNIVNQAIAPRRILPGLGKEEVQSALTEATEDEATGQISSSCETSSSDESEVENRLLKFEGSRDADESYSKPRLRVGPSLHLKAAPALHFAKLPISSWYRHFTITLLFALFMGIWL